MLQVGATGIEEREREREREETDTSKASVYYFSVTKSFILFLIISEASI
jgi:hypothetical protein